jgi:hypothetical protein
VQRCKCLYALSAAQACVSRYNIAFEARPEKTVALIEGRMSLGEAKLHCCEPNWFSALVSKSQNASFYPSKSDHNAKCIIDNTMPDVYSFPRRF